MFRGMIYDFLAVKDVTTKNTLCVQKQNYNTMRCQVLNEIKNKVKVKQGFQMRKIKSEKKLPNFQKIIVRRLVDKEFFNMMRQEIYRIIFDYRRSFFP